MDAAGKGRRRRPPNMFSIPKAINITGVVGGGR
jgi:hypothetical protein